MFSVLFCSCFLNLISIVYYLLIHYYTNDSAKISSIGNYRLVIYWKNIKVPDEKKT